MGKIARLYKGNKLFSRVINICIVIMALVILMLLAILIISATVKGMVSDKIFDTADGIQADDSFDCVIILGAGLKSDGTPSHMLEDRVLVGVEVFEHTSSDVILMSGDCSGEHYDEPSAMRKYAENIGVDPSCILTDGSGFSTYESITRAKEIYGFDKVIVITQEYHLYRALYIADKKGIDAVGVSADLRPYRNQFVREIREILAQVKDFFQCN